MKFEVTFKTPECLTFSNPRIKDVDDYDQQRFFTLTEKYVKYSEYVTLEFDTVENTVVVLPV